ncbi:MAG: hypothetical protein RL748_1751 [Pseudomonadota bacterium]|jgi:hypothetical protein
MRKSLYCALLGLELGCGATRFILNVGSAHAEGGQKMEYVSSVERILEERMLQRYKAEGELIAFKRLLTRRFGTIPESIMDRINAGTKEEADAWFDRAIDCATLDEVFLDHTH